MQLPSGACSATPGPDPLLPLSLALPTIATPQFLTLRPIRRASLTGHERAYEDAGRVSPYRSLTWRVLDARAGLRRRVTHPSAH